MGGEKMRTLKVTFELSTGSKKSIISEFESQRELLESLHKGTWFGTGNEKVNLNYVTYYEIEDITSNRIEQAKFDDSFY